MEAPEHIAYQELQLKRLEAQLIRNMFDVTIVQNASEALHLLKNAVTREMSIGFGGSRTLEQIGIIDYLANGDYPKLLNRNKKGLSPDEKEDIQRAMFSADVFLTGTNAITMDGRLLNIDKNGNRVAAMMYGPKKVYVAAGVNKICASEENAEGRAKQAAMMNAIRFNAGTPCLETLTCMDCRHSNRLCYYTTVIHRSWPARRIHIVLINETLGF
ncbi:MAG: lactate utilization protein [Spirochaetes bacterium]|nr:lactate utilization protein [Spirochaetota bacterium]